MKTIYFVRHGLSELNAAFRVSGRTETPLTKEGREQAKRAGKQAKDLGIEYIISSPLERALDTAKIIAKEIKYPVSKIEINPLFIERFFGAMEGQPYKPDTDYDGIVDAELTDAFLARTEQAVTYLKSLPYTKILVVSHGATGRALRHHIVADIPFHHHIKFNNAEIVEWQLHIEN